MYQYVGNLEYLKMKNGKMVKLNNGFAIVFTVYGQNPKTELVNFENHKGNKRYEADDILSLKFANNDFISLKDFEKNITNYTAVDITNDWENNRRAEYTLL